MRGLYKFRFTAEPREGSGVMFATAGGRLYGGDSGSSFVGHFTEADGDEQRPATEASDDFFFPAISKASGGTMIRRVDKLVCPNHEVLDAESDTTLRRVASLE